MKISRSLGLSISILALISLCIGAKASHAATFYVATTGNDANAGTAAAPFRTLQKGVRMLSAGDTLIVKGGTYAEGVSNIPSGSAGAATTIQAAPGERVMLQPNNYSIDCVILFANNQSYVTIDGLIIDGGNPEGTVKLTIFPVCVADAGTPGVTAHHLTFRNGEVRNARGNGFLISGTHWLIENVDVHHNGSNLQYDHGIYFEASYSTVTRSRIHDNPCWGLQNFSSGGTTPTDNTFTANVLYNNGCGGVTLTHGSNHLFANNVIYNNGSRDSAGILVFSPTTKVYNNTVYNNTGMGIIEIGGGSGIFIRNNIVYRNGAGEIRTTSATADHNFTSDPGFVNAAQADFHLAVGSGAIDTGATLSEVTMDLDTVPRTQGSRYDIGAYEYRTGSWPAPVAAPRNLRAVSQP